MRTRHIKTDGLVQQVLEAGFEDDNAPLVLLIHGFPELGISWRAQVQAMSQAGYHVVAPDMRGYGGTEKPEGVEAYAILHLVGDMVDLVRALGKASCIVVGHDWGAVWSVRVRQAAAGVAGRVNVAPAAPPATLVCPDYEVRRGRLAGRARGRGRRVRPG